MKYNRELKGWEKVLTRFQIPYIKFVYSRDAFDDWRIEIYRAYWRFRPKNYHVTKEFYRELREAAHKFYREWARNSSGASAFDEYRMESQIRAFDETTGAHLRRSPRGIVHIEAGEDDLGQYIRKARQEQMQLEKLAEEFRGPIANRDLGDEA